nr:DUF3892 domain-containing protein [uncultured Methylovirgula sp.]
MAARYQVTCINKGPTHHDPHTRIQAIGGVHNGQHWKLTEAQAIAQIESRTYEFYVSVKGHTVDVIVAIHLGRKYLKTRADDYSPDNLLSLPECP